MVIVPRSIPSQSAAGAAEEAEPPEPAPAAWSERKLPPGISGCTASGQVAYLAGGVATSNERLPAAVLSGVVGSAGSDLRLLQGTAAPAGTVPVSRGGQFQGRGSCDFTLADHPTASRLAIAGAATLAARGVPVASGGPISPGEQRYLLRSAAFRDSLAYILYVVPDPTSAQPNDMGGRTYTRNIYALAVVAEDGTVSYAATITA
jgi:hypothetical protein